MVHLATANRKVRGSRSANFAPAWRAIDTVYYMDKSEGVHSHDTGRHVSEQVSRIRAANPDE